MYVNSMCCVVFYFVGKFYERLGYGFVIVRVFVSMVCMWERMGERWDGWMEFEFIFWFLNL